MRVNLFFIVLYFLSKSLVYLQYHTEFATTKVQQKMHICKMILIFLRKTIQLTANYLKHTHYISQWGNSSTSQRRYKDR